jgi:hypothetical protein
MARQRSSPASTRRAPPPQGYPALRRTAQQRGHDLGLPLGERRVPLCSALRRVLQHARLVRRDREAQRRVLRLPGLAAVEKVADLHDRRDRRRVGALSPAGRARESLFREA